tara:strand:+ start:2603 stop:3676 length:1074 start_codon:yes stop_codon:yes gene_type:complete
MENSEESFSKIEILDSVEELQQSMSQETSYPEIAPESTPEPTPEPQVQDNVSTTETQTEPEQFSEPEKSYSNDDIDGAVFSYLSEKLGRDISSLDDINIETQEAPSIDERVSVIADFVSSTGRAPEDWFTFQSLNTEGMDDMTAVRVNMAMDHSNLSPQELDLLVKSKYNVDKDTQTEQQVQLAQLQLKMDAQAARIGIEKIRNDYATPLKQEQTQEGTSLISDEWVTNMSKEVDAFEGLEFDLGDGYNFTFGLSNEYRSELKQKNTELDTFFNSYVNKNGDWNFDLLSSHRAVIDNIDAIVANAYKQGMSSGRKGLVNQAANISMDAPQQATTDNAPNVAQQLQNIVGKKQWTFNI